MTYAISIVVLVALFTIGTATPINMGVLAFAAAFIVGGWVSGLELDDILGFFLDPRGNMVAKVESNRITGDF